jgi:hypothetical protein
MGRVGRYVQLKAHEGQRDVLVEHMLGVAQFLVNIPGCELYVIQEVAGGTRLRRAVVVESGSIVKLLEPLQKGAVQRQLRKHLHTLKDLLGAR